MKTDKLYFGAAYYSEYLPYDRVEKDMEMMCAIMTKELMKKTLNPFKRAHMKRSIDMFLGHCFGIDLVRRAIKREMEES